jgi:hypothetical protein
MGLDSKLTFVDQERFDAHQERFNALIAILDEALQFSTAGLHRVAPMQLGDAVRLTDLHNRLRALCVDPPGAAT